MGKSLQKIGEFFPGERIRFFDGLIEMLASEVEVCFPDRAAPGKEYDRAIERVKLLIRAKGQIHAYYKLNLRSHLDPEQGTGTVEAVERGIGDIDFLKKLLKDLDGNVDIQRRLADIISGVLGRVPVGTHRHDLSPSCHR